MIYIVTWPCCYFESRGFSNVVVNPLIYSLGQPTKFPWSLSGSAERSRPIHQWRGRRRSRFNEAACLWSRQRDTCRIWDEHTSWISSCPLQYLLKITPWSGDKISSAGKNMAAQPYTYNSSRDWCPYWSLEGTGKLTQDYERCLVLWCFILHNLSI